MCRIPNEREIYLRRQRLEKARAAAQPRGEESPLAWWAVLLRGVAGILFGHIMVVAPVTSLAALAPVFGAYALMDGVLAVAAGRRANGAEAWLEASAGVAAALLALARPGMGALGIVYLIAAWALVTGALKLAAGSRLNRILQRERLLLSCGAASIGFGAVLALAPRAGEPAVVLWVGAYALISGVLLLALSFRLRACNPQEPVAAAGRRANDRVWIVIK